MIVTIGKAMELPARLLNSRSGRRLYHLEKRRRIYRIAGFRAGDLHGRNRSGRQRRVVNPNVLDAVLLQINMSAVVRGALEHGGAVVEDEGMDRKPIGRGLPRRAGYVTVDPDNLT